MDSTGKSRLFVALGKSGGYDAIKLVNYIAETVGVDQGTIQEVTIMDDFSFVTAPFEQAELILQTFASIKKRGEKSLITKAKDKSGGG